MSLLESLNVIVTIASVAGAYFLLRKSAKKDIFMLEKRLDMLEKKLDEISNLVQSIDRRLTRLEGAFEERGRWESRQLGGK